MSDEKKGTLKRAEIIYVCIAMAVCITLAIVIAAVSSLDVDEISLPDISFSPVIPDISTDIPTGGDESNVDATVETKYYYPVPGGRIQKEHSLDRLVFSQSMKDWRTHCGVDISGEVGTDVLCYADGTVDKVYTDVLYGKTVEILHADGSVTVYSNLDENLPGIIDIGTEVFAGEKIGKIGATAGAEAAEGAHLHFEMRRGKDYIDPANYLISCTLAPQN